MGKTWHSRKERPLTHSERQEMDDFVDMGSRVDLTAEQEKTADVDTLVRHNVKRAADIAQSYIDRGVPLGDLLQAAWIAVWKSAELYDGSTRFSTYATPSIHRACERATQNEGSAVRLPVHLLDGSTDKKHQSKSEALATDNRSQGYERRKQHTRDAANTARSVLSLDAPIESVDAENANDLLLDWCEIEDNDAGDEAMAIIDQDQYIEMSARALSALNDREAEIVKMMFGIGCVKMSMREIAPHLGITYGRVQQISVVAMEKMRKELSGEEL